MSVRGTGTRFGRGEIGAVSMAGRAGWADSGGLIAQALRELTQRRGDVRRIVLTHFHEDHAGAAAEIAAWSAAEVIAGAGDAGRPNCRWAHSPAPARRSRDSATARRYSAALPTGSRRPPTYSPTNLRRIDPLDVHRRCQPGAGGRIP